MQGYFYRDLGAVRQMTGTSLGFCGSQGGKGGWFKGRFRGGYVDCYACYYLSSCFFASHGPIMYVSFKCKRIFTHSCDGITFVPISGGKVMGILKLEES